MGNKDDQLHILYIDKYAYMHTHMNVGGLFHLRKQKKETKGGEKRLSGKQG